MKQRLFTGFGLGSIQSGLFLLEAFRSGHFDRLVVSEIDPEIVDPVRAGDGSVTVNVAHTDRIEAIRIPSVRVLNPFVADDRRELLAAVAEADEFATALPSVEFFRKHGAASPAACLADGLASRDAKRPAVIYTAENNNHAAELLDEALGASRPETVQVLNTVLGKMCGVITDPDTISRLGLQRFAPTSKRAVLVEAFNQIQITRVGLPGYERGLSLFEEKDDLLPFEEAKLCSINATHALLGYLAHDRGLVTMADLVRHQDLLDAGREAFVNECGAGIAHRHGTRDVFFTREAFAARADDLLARMTNPFLSDAVARVIRDPRRKLAWNDRLIGAMRLALEAGVKPVQLARGARSAMAIGGVRDVRGLWPESVQRSVQADEVAAMLSP